MKETTSRRASRGQAGYWQRSFKDRGEKVPFFLSAQGSFFILQQ
jgi:hypothetical protein